METTTTTYKSHFSLCFRKFLVEHRKTLLAVMGGYLGFWLITGIWTGMMGFIPGETGCVLYILLAFLICAVVASVSFNELASKEKRISLLMTPGTAPDKYLTRVLVAVPGMIILAIIGYYVFYFTQILAYGITTDIWLPVNTFTIELHTGRGDIIVLCTIIAMFIFNEALYTFGAIAWPRKSFLKTTGIFIVLQMVLSFSSMIVFKFALKNVTFFWDGSDLEGLAWTVISIVFVIDALLFWGAYRKLKNIQLV